MSSRSSFGVEMEKRKAHLEGLLGYQLKEDLEALNRCAHVFNKNAEELAAHVGVFLRSEQHSRDVSEDYVNELVRFLHNYLTSVTSLVDSQRVVMRHRWPTGRLYEGNCPTCDRPLLSTDSFSEFESCDYAEKLTATFETGEAAFMGKLRNYCTHYSIPLPNLGTTIRFAQGMPAVERVNTLQLDQAKLLRWNGWTRPAKNFLDQQEGHFDLVPIIERYVNAANQFAAWFWSEINIRSYGLIDELNTKALELMRWHDEKVSAPDWIERGDREPPPGWNGRLWRAGQRRDRYEGGSRGFRLWEINGAGSVSLLKDDEWTPLPR